MRQRQHRLHLLIGGVLAVGLLLTLSACNLNSAAEASVPAPQVPQVMFNAPVNQATIFEDTLIDIDLVATDDETGIALIELYVDGELLEDGRPDSGAEPVYRVTMNWFAAGVGLHTLTAIAYQPNGTASPEATIVVEVVARN